MTNSYTFKYIKCDEIDEAMRIGAILKRIRLKHGLTGKQVSRILGLNDGDFVKFEAGRVIPREDPCKFIVAVADALRGIEPKAKPKPEAPMKGRKICKACYRNVHAVNCAAQDACKLC